MITLDDESIAIAKEMNNYSAFVRMATKATRDGGLELVSPGEITAMKALVIAFNRLQKKDGYNSERVTTLLDIIADLRIEERGEE